MHMCLWERPELGLVWLLGTKSVELLPESATVLKTAFLWPALPARVNCKSHPWGPFFCLHTWKVWAWRGADDRRAAVTFPDARKDESKPPSTLPLWGVSDGMWHLSLWMSGEITPGSAWRHSSPSATSGRARELLLHEVNHSRAHQEPQEILKVWVMHVFNV